MSKTSPFSNMNRRQRIITLTSAVALIALCAVILTTPRLKEIVAGPSATQVALQREQARAADLKRKLDAAEALLEQPRPMPTDQVALSRADDLASQLEDAEAKLRQGNPIQYDKVQAARADDLQRQLSEAVRKLKAPRFVPPIVVRANKTKAQIVASKKVFGLYTAQSPFQYAEFNLVQDLTRRDADISGYFQSWHDEFRPDAIQAAWYRGDVPLLTWESQDQVGVVNATNAKYSLPKIIGGDFDPYLHRYAKGIKKLGLPVIIRFDHEMNGNWYPWSETRADGSPINGNRKGDYAKMWRHVHDIFEAEGANKYVAWLWAPNRVNAIPNQPLPKAFYPGDRYVDIIGMSGYYRPYDDRASFAETYGRTLPLLRDTTRRKPILLAEIGATEDRDKKAYWMRSLFANLSRAENRDIMGFVWFNFAVTSRSRGVPNTNDWRINSTPKSIRTMSELLWVYGYGRPRGARPVFPAEPAAPATPTKPATTTPAPRLTSVTPTTSPTPTITPMTTPMTTPTPTVSATD